MILSFKDVRGPLKIMLFVKDTKLSIFVLNLKISAPKIKENCNVYG